MHIHTLSSEYLPHPATYLASRRQFLVSILPLFGLITGGGNFPEIIETAIRCLNYSRQVADLRQATSTKRVV